jgi:hypothetical protein
MTFGNFVKVMLKFCSGITETSSEELSFFVAFFSNHGFEKLANIFLLKEECHNWLFSPEESSTEEQIFEEWLGNIFEVDDFSKSTLGITTERLLEKINPLFHAVEAVKFDPLQIRLVYPVDDDIKDVYVLIPRDAPYEEFRKRCNIYKRFKRCSNCDRCFKKPLWKGLFPVLDEIVLIPPYHFPTSSDCNTVFLKELDDQVMERNRNNHMLRWSDELKRT